MIKLPSMQACSSLNFRSRRATGPAATGGDVEAESKSVVGPGDEASGENTSQNSESEE